MLVFGRFQYFRALLSSDSLCSHNQTQFSCVLESPLIENGFLKLLFYSLVTPVCEVPRLRESLCRTMFIVITRNKDCG